MTHPSVAALEAAFQAVRDQDAPLAERLRVVTEAYRASAPLYADAAQRLIDRLASVDAGAGAPRVGEVMPRFVMPDHDGRLVSMDSLLEAGPVVLVLHRGHWCPYCRVSMAGLARIQDKVAPAQLVALSAETQKHTRALREEARAGFPFLTDVGAGYALSLNLAIWIDEAMSKMIDRTGWNVPSFQGGGGWILPIPAVFVIGADGVIAARHVDPDYRRRMDLDELLGAIDRVRR